MQNEPPKNRKTECVFTTSNEKTIRPRPGGAVDTTDMKQPPDRLLDSRGTGTDVPSCSRAGHGVRDMHIPLVAHALAVPSTPRASQSTRLFARWPTPMRSPIVLNCSWWYSWPLLSAVVIWLCEHFQLE